MSNADTLKKYKELLDHNIITQEEFEKKKREVLAFDAAEPDAKQSVSEKLTHKTGKNKVGKKLIKIIIIVITIIAMLLIGISIVTSSIERNQQEARATALEEAAKTIMKQYRLNTYEVKYTGGGYDIYAPAFELLTPDEALECLKQLDNISIDDPCGEGKIDFGLSTHVHPGLDIDYSYWRISSSQAKYMSDQSGTKRTPGIYCDQYGTECIFASER